MLFLRGVSTEISSFLYVISRGVLKEQDWKLIAADWGDLSPWTILATIILRPRIDSPSLRSLRRYAFLFSLSTL